MIPGTYKRFARLLVLSLMVAFGACGQNKILRETIVDGEQFAHRIQLPGRFRKANVGRERIPFDHYAFRMLASWPDILLLTACKFDVPIDSKSRLDEEICSPDAFVIDTAHSVSARVAEPGEWAQAVPVQGYFDMNDPTHLTLKEFYQRPAELRATPITKDGNIEYQGFKFKGKSYMRRGTWIRVLSASESADGRAFVIAGADTRKLPDPNKVFLGDPIGGGSFGTFTVDIFDTNTGRRLAAVDAGCDINVILCLRRANVANSRWFVIALDDSLQKVLLFDFKSSPKAPAQR